jgi:hypothetical protein
MQCLLLLVFWAAIGFQEAHAQTAQPAPIQFTNATAAAGIKFVHYPGNKGMAIIREVFGPGVCVADFDGDGWQDIYLLTAVISMTVAFRRAMRSTTTMVTARLPM